MLLLALYLWLLYMNGAFFINIRDINGDTKFNINLELKQVCLPSNTNLFFMKIILYTPPRP